MIRCINYHSLLQLGDENPAIKLEYTSSMTLMNFPLNYEQAVILDYKPKGLYSSPADMQFQGQNKDFQLETCRWYSKGYRYLVFETVKSTWNHI